MKKYKFIEHTADIKFQAIGQPIEVCFKNASYALKEIICKQKIKNKKKEKIRVKGTDFESLLYNFLEEFLFLLETKNFIHGRVENMKITATNKGKDLILSAEVLGDDSKNYELESHVKAITYNDMFVKIDEKKHHYICQVVVDV